MEKKAGIPTNSLYLDLHFSPVFSKNDIPFFLPEVPYIRFPIISLAHKNLNFIITGLHFFFVKNLLSFRYLNQIQYHFNTVN